MLRKFEFEISVFLEIFISQLHYCFMLIPFGHQIYPPTFTGPLQLCIAIFNQCCSEIFIVQLIFGSSFLSPIEKKCIIPVANVCVLIHTTCMYASIQLLQISSNQTIINFLFIKEHQLNAKLTSSKFTKAIFQVRISTTTKRRALAETRCFFVGAELSRSVLIKNRLNGSYSRQSFSPAFLRIPIKRSHNG